MLMRFFQFWAAALTFALLLSVACTAQAQPASVDEEKGRDLAVQAMGHYQESDFEAALEKFSEAEKVYPTAQVLRMKGYALIGLGRWRDAAESIEKALESDYKPLNEEDTAHARQELDKALDHLAMVTVTSPAPEATVRVDDDGPRELPAKLRLEPGMHRFLVEAPEHEPEERREDLQAGPQQLAFELQAVGTEGDGPPPPPKPEPVEEPKGGDGFGWFPGQGPLGLTMLSVGVVAGGVGIASAVYGTTLRAAVQENIDIHNQNYDASCAANSDLCRHDVALINRDGRRARDWQNLGIGLGIAGGSLAVVGAVLFVFSDDSGLGDGGGESADELSLRCSGGLGISCHGTF